jgi:XTP/dITP diphosphohydrolase
MLQLVLATANQGKAQEFKALLTPLGWDVRTQSEWAVPDCPEPHITFVENALTKARYTSGHIGLPSLADDSGLCVKALGGEPGVRSARYACEHEGDAKSDAANNAKLLQALQGVEQRQAYFICALVAVKSPNDPEPLIAIGRWHGTIGLQASGSNGFGYDPLFICAATGLSAASMSKVEKSAVSHRGIAVAQMVELIQRTW